MSARNMLDPLLQELGLNDKERVVAKVIHSLGTVRASTVARACDLPRNTVRGILDSLVSRGIVFRSRSRNAQYYGLESKENLVRTFEQQKESLEQELERKLAAVDKFGGTLARSVNRALPRVTFYDGYEGIKRVYEDTLSSKTGLRSWASFDPNVQTLPNYFRTYYTRRAKRNIRMTSIHPDTTLARAHCQRNEKELRQSVLVPQERYNWRPEIQVYDNKVNIVSWDEKLGIIIESSEIAAAFKAIFDLSFDTARIAFEKNRKT